jgi:hypothetical protein
MPKHRPARTGKWELWQDLGRGPVPESTLTFMQRAYANELIASGNATRDVRGVIHRATPKNPSNQPPRPWPPAKRRAQ